MPAYNATQQRETIKGGTSALAMLWELLEPSSTRQYKMNYRAKITLQIGLLLLIISLGKT